MLITWLPLLVLVSCYRHLSAFNIEDEYVGFEVSPKESSLEFLEPSKPPALDLGLDKATGCRCRTEIGTLYVCFGRNSCTGVPKNLDVRTPIFSIVNTQIQTLKPLDFEMMANVSDMIIEGNSNLVNIMPDTFKFNSKLNNLSLSFNFNLKKLHKYSFRGLDNLQTICLVKNGFNNIIDITSALPPNIVPHLVRLSLSQNSFLNILPTDFAPMIGNRLEILNLVLCRIDYLHPNSFELLNHLRILRLGENNFNTSTITNVLERSIQLGLPLQLLDLSSLGFRSVLPRRLLEVIANSNVSHLSLSKNHFEVISSDSFPLMPNLQVLDLSSVSTLDISDDAFKNLPNLKKLRLKKNKLYIMQKGIMLPNLRYLDLEENSGDNFMSSYFDVQNGIFANMSQLQYLNLNLNRILHLYNKSFAGLDKLEILGLKNASIFNIPNYTFSSLKNLKFLNLENNLFVKYEYARGIPCHLFAGLDSLQVLFLGGCEINIFSLNCNPFIHLKSLLHLGLERNRISHISSKQFAPLVNLTSINLSFNLLTVWDERIFPKNLHLHRLIMSYNRLIHISQTMLDDFANMTELELYYNPFDCCCNLYETMNTWIVKNNFNRTHFQNLYLKANCLTLNYTVTDFFRSVMEDLIDCQVLNNFRTVILLPLALLFLFFMTLVFFVYYYRWHIKYWIFLTRLYLSRTGKIKANVQNRDCYVNYAYDAFVSYCNEDRNFVVRLVAMLENYEPHLKLCVYERDFQIGSVISESVLENVAKSRKTLLVISDNYAKSQWCRWESQIAEHHRLFFENGNGEYVDDTLVLVKLGPVSKTNLTPTLRYLLKTRIYLQWESDFKKQKIFWDKLRSTLASPKSAVESTHI